MMNRTFSILSVLSFLALAIYSFLIVLGVLNPIIHFKFILVVFSLFFTFTSLGLFIHRQEVSKLQLIVLVFLLTLPVFTPLIGLFAPDAYTQFWKLFLGGMIFQIGTGVYAILGGFIRKGISSSLKIITVVNYVLFLFLAFIFLFDIILLMHRLIFGIVGGIASLLSLLILFLRKPTINF